jgi:hypothetical protein
MGIGQTAKDRAGPKSFMLLGDGRTGDFSSVVEQEAEAFSTGNQLIGCAGTFNG